MGKMPEFRISVKAGHGYMLVEKQGIRSAEFLESGDRLVAAAPRELVRVEGDGSEQIMGHFVRWAEDGRAVVRPR